MPGSPNVCPDGAVSNQRCVAAGDRVPAGIPVGGLYGCSFRPALLAPQLKGDKMTLKIDFTEKELVDIQEALRLAPIHNHAPEENHRWHTLSEKISAATEFIQIIKETK